MPYTAPNLLFFKGQQPRISDKVIEKAPKKVKKEMFESIEQREANKKKALE